METNLLQLVAVSLLACNSVYHASQESDEVLQKKVRGNQDVALKPRNLPFHMACAMNISV